MKMFNYNNYKLNLVVYLVLFVLFYLANYISSIFGIIAFIVIVLMVLFCGVNSIFNLLFFLMPNIRILDCVGISHLINISFLLISLKYLLLNLISNYKNSNGLKIDLTAVIGASLIFVLEILHCLYNNYASYSNIISALNISFDLLIVLILIRDKNVELNYLNLCYSLLFGVINSAIVFLLVNNGYLNSLLTSWYRFSAFGNDPNYYSVYILMGISGLLLVISNKKIRIYDLVLIFMSIFFGLLTVSKMFIICIVLLFVIYFIILFIKNPKKSLMILVLFSIALSFIYFIQFDNINSLLNKFLDRFSSANGIDEISTGRYSIQISYFKSSMQDSVSFFFGRGLDYYSFYQEYGFVYVSHNTFLDFFISWGLFGVSIFLIIFVYNVKDNLKFSGQSKINYVPMLLLFIMFIALSCMTSDMFWYLIMFVLLPFKKSIKLIDYNENKCIKIVQLGY